MALSLSFGGAKVYGGDFMQPPLIVWVPWIIALVLEASLLVILFRNRLNRELPVFTSVVLMYGIIDYAVFTAAAFHFHTYSMFALREVSCAVLRTWLLIALCRSVLGAHHWARRFALAALTTTAVLLIGLGFPTFLSEHHEGVVNTYLGLGVYFRTIYLTHLGILAILFLMHIRTTSTACIRDIGIAIGLATASGAELTSLTMRDHIDSGNAYTPISLSYIGMITAITIWIMFVRAPGHSHAYPSAIEENSDIENEVLSPIAK